MDVELFGRRDLAAHVLVAVMVEEVDLEALDPCVGIGAHVCFFVMILMPYLL